MTDRPGNRPLRIFLSAGEHSGDAHGAALARRLRERVPDVRLEGLGGPLMRAEGVELMLDLVEHAAMGLIPVLKKGTFFLSVLRDAQARLAADPPDLVVPIDYPGLNLRLSRRARAVGVPVCFYVSPQVWAWRPGRIHKIARSVDHMMLLFPFEKPLYDQAGVPCTVVGHPLFDELRLRRPSPAFRDGLGLDPATPLVGLLPGSREHEVRNNLPLELAAARRVREGEPSVRFAIPVAKPSLQPLIEACCAEYPELDVAILPGKASDVARVSRAAISVSGTATLELLHYQCPTVVVYRLGRAQEWLKRRLLTTKYITLVNVLAGREVYPEFATARDCAAEVAERALGFLRPGRARKRCLAQMKNVLREVDLKGSHGLAADTVLRVARAARAGEVTVEGSPSIAPLPSAEGERSDLR